MRISDTMLSQTYLNNVYKSKQGVEKLTTQIATGSKLNKPSDSPSGTARLLRLTSTIETADVYIKNIQEGIANLTETSNALEGMIKNVTDARVIFTEIQNPSNTNNIDEYANRLDLILDSMLNLANTEYNGKYLFAGTDFDAKPYGFTSDGSAVELKVTDVSADHKVKISENINQKININGTELFGSIGAGDIFNTIKKISDDLKGGSLPGSADVQIINDFYDNLLNKTTQTGVYINRLNDSEQLLNQSKLTIQELISKEKDIDVVEATINLEQQDYLLQVAYKTSSMILPKSLVDFI
ncbi:MAG: hypothetical protein JW995_14910 [Melioribacteraceae bacterium]|nr:hypothetical protein [Melioribacteraceae bacterium]